MLCSAIAAAPPAVDRSERLLRLMYQQHARALLAFALKLTNGDRQRAEDVVQETLLRAWRHSHSFDVTGGRSLRPWLTAVARHIVIDWHRSQRIRPPENYGQDLSALPLPNTSDEMGQVLRRMTVGEALRSLTLPHREILFETYFRGRTAREAAVALGLPVGTVKSRVYYALRALRHALAERGVTKAS